MNQSRLTNSLADAWQGLTEIFLQEQNFRIQLFFGLLVLLVSMLLKISTSSILLLVCLVMLVLVLEVLNSVVERILDVLKPRLHSQVKMIKDMMAGAVLLASIGCVIVGLTIFLPSIIEAIGMVVVH
ncbi:MAG: diacylglycerol kinase [Candidatus Magasanikbacteria bacterium]|nr:diacylglycerol kinase [Candidatus Magasanikbacteria bacterium]